MSVEDFTNMPPNLASYAPNSVEGISTDVPIEVIGAESIGRFRMLASLAAVSLEVGGGILRYGTSAAVFAATKDPVLAAGTMMGTTAVIEGTAAVAAPDIVAQDNKLTRGLEKVVGGLIPIGTKVSPLAATVITNYAGVSALEYAKYREDPTKSRDKYVRPGLIAAGLLTPACGVQVYLVTEGIADPTDIKNWATLGGFLAIAIGAGKWAKNKLSRRGVSQ